MMKKVSFRKLFTPVLAVLALGGPHAAQSQDISSAHHQQSRDQTTQSDRSRTSTAPRAVLPATPVPKGPSHATGTQTFLLRKVSVHGNTKVSDDEIAIVTREYQGKEVAIEDLSRMRDEITQLYVSKGYVSSGATLPSQDARNGEIRLEVIEGVLEGVVVEGLESLDAPYVTDRFGAEPNGVVNLRDYETRFRVLLDDSAIQEVHADLRPGKSLGTAQLVLKVKESERFATQLNFANERSPSVGGDRGSIEFFLRNAAFSGDYLKLETGITSGTYDGSLSYAVPLSVDGLVWSTAIDYSHAKAIEEPLTALDILSESLSVNTGVSYPIFNDNSAELVQKLTLTGALNFQYSETSLGGVPFPFSPGSVDGTTQYLSGVIGGQYSLRSSDTVLALGSDLKFGLYALEADTSGPSTPDPHFWLASARAQLVHRIDDSGLQLIARVEGQYTDEPLFVPDRFSAGGLDSVRGYRKNRALADFGLNASVEFQRPLLSTGLFDSSNRQDLSVFAFLDAAHFWNAGPSPLDINRLAGIGGGVAWEPVNSVSARLTFAKALNELSTSADKDLQDQGVYFQVSVRPSDWF